MYEVAPTILESRLLGSNNIVDAAVVGIPDKENGEVSSIIRSELLGKRDFKRVLTTSFPHVL